MFLAKILILLMYSNLMEYVIHRWAEHGPLWDINHKKHHDDPETPSLLAHSALGVSALAAIIGLSGLLFSFWGWAPVVFFLLYYILLIEGAHFICHRFHISKHHMTHHADLKDGNYNIWIPFGDWLFGTKI